MKQSYTVGLLMRGTFRRELIAVGLKFIEEKGFFDSQFTVDAPRQAHDKIKAYIMKVQYFQEYDYFEYKIPNGPEVKYFLDFIASMRDPRIEIEHKKGWFKTKVTVFCHHSVAKRLDLHLKVSTVINNQPIP